jgi:sterol desaturase/sphingolipid hydroxylase (fatty acid hydroxylase superfamily)
MTSAMTSLILTPLLIVSAAIGFMILERAAPGRELPNAPGWYGRALLITLVQVGITLTTSRLWTHVFGNAALFDLGALRQPVLEGFAGWLAGTFVFYWWHRLRHMNGWWVLFHQVHHSPARIETVTSFYKHPVEILADSALAAAILFPLLGCSVAGAVWCNLFAAVGEFFYHSNYKSPWWLKYLIQPPELHSLHHELGVYAGNFGDLPIWDRLFGTYRDADDFAARCGFPDHNERHLARMLLFQDVYDRRP